MMTMTAAKFLTHMVMMTTESGAATPMMVTSSAKVMRMEYKVSRDRKDGDLLSESVEDQQMIQTVD